MAVNKVAYSSPSPQPQTPSIDSLSSQPAQDTGWLRRYFEHLVTERGLAPNTLESYRRDFADFTDLVVDPLQASTDDIRAFIVARLNKDLSPRSVRRQVSAVRGFYQFVFNEGGRPDDPSRYVRAPRAHRTIVRPTTRQEVDSMVEFIGANDPLSLRNRALLYAAYGSGFRATELINLQIADLHFAHQVAKVRKGKGLKDRQVPMNTLEMEAIQLYLANGRPKLIAGASHDVLFVAKGGEPITRQRLWQIMTNISNDVVGRLISPHKYRHAFVADNVNGGAGFRTVQKMVGHASVTTTMGYMHSDLHRIRTEYLRTHPRGVAA